ncbi:MAG: sugar ABC transporter permease, partial [Maritimibacter sp.]|nr:sugar ABC transporter permease [Maritimibacter sp.]
MNPRLLPYVMILPVTLFLCLFLIYPFLLVAKQAFHVDGSWSLANFQEVIGYWKFPISMKNTLLLALAVV